MEVLVLIVLALSFATLVTVHVSLSFGLLARGPWWHGVVAFLAPPLGVYLGFREKLRLRSILWTLSALVYVAARVAAREAG